MKKMFKKSIAMLIAVLMVISAMPFTAITAFAATGTLSNSGFTIVYNNSNNNSNTRWENNQFNIVNDQQYDNTSVGILKYNISALKGKTIDSATLNFSVDSFNGDGNGLVFYYSNRLSNVTLNNGSTGDSKLSYGEGTTANTGAASRYGFDVNNVLTTVSRGDTASKSVDIASAVKSVLSSGSTEFYVFIMQKTAGGSGGNQITGATAGWTDTKIKPANVTINYSISNHIDNTKYSSKPATVFSPKKGTATVYWKESSDTSCSGAYNNLLYFNNYSEGISGTATANTGNNNCYTRAWYPTFVLLYDGVNDSYAPVMGSACKDDFFNSSRYLNYFVPMDSNNSSNLADSSNFYCDVWKGGEGSTLDYSWNSSQTHHEVRPSVTDNSGSTFGLAKSYRAHSSKLHIKDTITFEGNNGYSHAQNIYWFAGSHTTQGIGAASGDKNFGQANKTTYVVNYEPLYDAANEAAKALQTFNQNDYTIASVNAYYDAINELYNFDPNTYFNGVSEDGVSGAVNSCAYAIKSAVDNYNNKKKALVKKATYTFVNINGTTVKSVKAENSAEALKEAPENSVATEKKSADKDQHKWTEYSWPTTATNYTFTEVGTDKFENHNYGAETSEVVTSATCGIKGTMKYTKTCTDCGHESVRTEDIPATGAHDCVYTKKDSSVHTVTCKNCDYSVEEAHDIVDGKCTKCGYIALDLDTYNAAITEADGIIANSDGKYTADSVTAYKAAVDTAKAKTYSTQKEIDAIISEIQSAQTLLQKARVTITFVVEKEDGTYTTDTKNSDWGESVNLDTQSNYVSKWTIDVNGVTSKIDSNATAIDHVATENATIKAYVTDEQPDTKYSKVTFLGKNSAVVGIYYVKSGDTVATTDLMEKAPEVPFYDASGWDRDTIVADGSDFTVKATYTAKAVNENKCNVHFNGTDKQYAYDSYVYLFSADKSKKYAMYADAEGNELITYLGGVDFSVPRRDDIYIKEVNADEMKAAIGFSGSYQQGLKSSFNVKFWLPEDATLIETGVDLVAKFPDGTVKRAHDRATKFNARNEYTYTASFSNSKKTVEFKPYLTYLKDGEKTTVYGTSQTVEY